MKITRKDERNNYPFPRKLQKFADLSSPTNNFEEFKARMI